MTETCGCDSREGHAEPFVDPVLYLRHGERDDDCSLPHAVPGTGYWTGYYHSLPDVYCFCGHPNYLTCMELDGGGMSDVTLHNVGGYILSTMANEGD